MSRKTDKVEASKETAGQAMEYLLSFTGERTEAVAFVERFLAAAAKRLPSEAAIAKDKARKKKYGGASARRDGTGAVKPKG